MRAKWVFNSTTPNYTHIPINSKFQLLIAQGRERILASRQCGHASQPDRHSTFVKAGTSSNKSPTKP